MGLSGAPGEDARALGGVRLAAIGPGTDKALRAHGLRADYVPEIYDAAHLGEGLAAKAQGRVLMLRAAEGSPALTDALDRAGTAYDDIPIYTTRYENPQSEVLRAQVERTPTLVTFTSASTVKGFVSSVGEEADLSRVTGICIGARTAAEAEKHGISVRVAAQATMEELVKAVSETAGR